MYWSMTWLTPGDAPDSPEPAGRFVLHRHRDSGGPHYDLRLEHDGCLLGWRIDGASLHNRPWATEKPPHPLRWLERDAPAAPDDEGTYAWLERGADRRVLILRGRQGDRLVRFDREEGLTPRTVRAVRQALDEAGLDPDAAPKLVADGLTARRRAIERLCGLGRELDGDAFDDVLWRKSTEALSLDEIHAQLRSFELRFDLKYPPQPVSTPEPLPDEPDAARAEQVRTILSSQ